MPETLKKIGSIIGVREGKMIVKLTREISLSTRVYTKDGRLLGKLSRLFGPTKAPYAAIKTKGEVVKEIYVR